MSRFVVATIKPWNIAAFERRRSQYPGEWHLIENPVELNVNALEQVDPRFVFFPHWSWIVPREILERWECVCFHMTDLPYGRGGSPLQNLIVRGHSETVLTALRMAEDLDAGPVYLKTRLNLDGSASEIYRRAADLVFDLIGRIVTEEPTPKPQQGEVVSFERRKPEDSRLPQRGSLEQLFDHIRMLDAETYPSAFIESGDYRLEFEKAKLDDDGVLRAQVEVRIRTEESETQER